MPVAQRVLHRFAKQVQSVQPPSPIRRVRSSVGSGERSHLSLRDLAARIAPGNWRFVGIDLTGSERRPSGWCLLEGSRASTRRIATDADLVAATLESSPTVVSIDSPLSLPAGRVTVADDDPGRKLYGITRRCERILRRRGVNVYPCLIPSMQALTQRGIRLAGHLRRLGIPVIESFPGAAQDILRIPRKRASLELLSDGLVNCGITGTFAEGRVSHDELDAITSALVGLFFWADKYEALGDDEEDYLIVPAVEADDSSAPRHVVGLSGRICAGKTTAARFFEERGYTYTRYSLVLAEDLLGIAAAAPREQLQTLGSAVHSSGQQRALGVKTIRRCGPARLIVVDGMRWPEDHSLMVERFGGRFTHIHVDAPIQLRTIRFLSAGGTAERFSAVEAHPVESGSGSLTSLAHHVVQNSASKDDFYASLDSVRRSSSMELA